MSKHRSRRLNSHINIVPYIDVMLVLLVIFMATAPLISPGTIDLPQVNQASANSVAAIEVVVQENGHLQLIDHDPLHFLEQTSNLENIANLAHSRMLSGQARPVVISADKQVVYNEVLLVMDTLKSAGIQRVGLSVLSKNPL